MSTLVQRRYIVLIEWCDAGVIDTDELAVFAHDEVEARTEATKIWHRMVGAQWHECMIERVTVYTPTQLRNASA